MVVSIMKTILLWKNQQFYFTNSATAYAVTPSPRPS